MCVYLRVADLSLDIYIYLSLPQELYACSIAESQNPFSNIVHLSHTSLHSSNLVGDGTSAITRASIIAMTD